MAQYLLLVVVEARRHPPPPPLLLVRLAPVAQLQIITQILGLQIMSRHVSFELE